MPFSIEAHERHGHDRRHVAPWLTIAAAVGIGAAAFVIARRYLPASAVKEVDDLIDICERLSTTLEQRSAQLSLVG